MADLGKGGGEVWRVAAVHISQFQRGEAFGVGYGEGVEQPGGTEDWVDSRGGDSGGVWGFGYDLRAVRREVGICRKDWIRFLE